MARYSKAKWLPIPENHQQSHINPTQFILHSIAAPWDENRIQQFWNERGIDVEAHFSVDYDGSMGQFLDTSVRADANVSANYRAISVESAANLSNSNKWTAAQVHSLVGLMVWAHHTHGIPARICRNETDPGFGYHRQFASWSGGGTACPGTARVAQFKSEVFPAFLRAIGHPNKPPQVPVVPTIRVSDVQPGDRNDSVRIVQTALINRGFQIPSGPTGYFGEESQAAYSLYQKSLKYRGADADGVPGEDSLQKLLPKYKVV
jgi:hypothetical protein